MGVVLFSLAVVLLVFSKHICCHNTSFKCKSVVDCNNGGACDVESGLCACDGTWKGETCAALALLPAPSVGDGDYDYVTSTGNNTWGGSILADPLDGETCHMFTSLFLKGTLNDWETKSIVVRMESRQGISGPYVFADVVASPRRNASPPLWDSLDCHNPTIHKIGDEYVVFYIGVGVNMERTRGPEYSQPNLDKAQTIGAAFATSPRGPWTRLRQPLLVADQEWECGGARGECGVSNPAVVVNRTRSPNGNYSVLMFYRGNQDRGIGVASAPSWRGPYTKSKESTTSNGIFKGSIVVGLEDMYVWENPVAAVAGSRPGCHMILHQEEQGIENLGAHAFTTDPSCISGWQLSMPRPSHAYGPDFAWDNGTTTTFGSRERPQIVLDPHSGSPSHLSNGVILKPASAGGWSGASFTLIAPIAISGLG